MLFVSNRFFPIRNSISYLPSATYPFMSCDWGVYICDLVCDDIDDAVWPIPSQFNELLTDCFCVEENAKPVNKDEADTVIYHYM